MAQQEEPQSWAAKRREAERRNSDNEAQQVKITFTQFYIYISYDVAGPNKVSQDSVSDSWK